MAKTPLKLVPPSTVKRTVTPKRRRNGDLRTREYMTEAEVERLMKAAAGNRHGHRDATMILVAYRHGLRVSELVDLRWHQVDFRMATPARAAGQAGHSQHGNELRALRRLQREQDPKSPFVFTSEREAPFTRRRIKSGGLWCEKRARLISETNGKALDTSYCRVTSSTHDEARRIDRAYEACRLRSPRRLRRYRGRP